VEVPRRGNPWGESQAVCQAQPVRYGGGRAVEVREGSAAESAGSDAVLPLRDLCARMGKLRDTAGLGHFSGP